MEQTTETFVDKNGRRPYSDTKRFAPSRGKLDAMADGDGSGNLGVGDLGIGDLAELRGVAMELARNLRKMMPPKRKARTPPAGRPAEKPDLSTEKTKKAEPLPPEFDRLLSRNDGVIDGFATLVQLVIRIRDKEQEARDQTQSALPIDEFDEDELDRRIEEELDRIAERRRAADELEAGAAQQEG
jgi:hypothetical protein